MSNSNNNTFKKLTFQQFQSKFWEIARKNNLTTKDKKGRESLSTFRTQDVIAYMLYEDLHSIKEILTDCKMMPDSRFDQVADEIDSIKKDVELMKKSETEQIIKKNKIED